VRLRGAPVADGSMAWPRGGSRRPPVEVPSLRASSSTERGSTDAPRGEGEGPTLVASWTAAEDAGAVGADAVVSELKTRRE